MRFGVSVYLQVSESDLEPYLAKVKDTALKHALQYGLGFVHETMPAAEREVVDRLFATGAIQVHSHASCLKNRTTPSHVYLFPEDLARLPLMLR